MKKYIKVIGLVIFAAVFASCEEFLEEDPSSELTQGSFYKTVDDLRIAVNGVVKPLYDSRGNMPGAHRSFQMFVGGDDLTTQPTSKTQWIAVDQFNQTPSERFIDISAWRIPYQIIKQANNVIEVKDQIEGNEEEINKLVAIAYFWRGWAHFQASRFYGDIPIITSTLVDLELTKDPVLEVYEQVQSDLLEAEKYLPTSWNSEDNYPDKYAVKALLADFYITWAGWPIKDVSKYALSASYSEDVINNSGAELLDDYAELWKYDEIGTYDDSKESVWEIVAVTNSEVATNAATRPVGKTFVSKAEAGGFADFFCEIGFFNRFPDSYRKQVTFTTEWKGVSFQDEPKSFFHPFYNKFRGSFDYSPTGDPTKPSKNHLSGANFVVYRYADMLTLYAEAKAMSSGPDASAYEALNKVRRRANNVDWRVPNATYDLDFNSGLGAEEFRDEVLDERAWEFAAEQRRWFDLVRTEKVEWAVTTKDAKDIPVVGSVTKEDYLFPIPANEILLNPNLVQNPGY